MTETWVDVC